MTEQDRNAVYDSYTRKCGYKNRNHTVYELSLKVMRLMKENN